LERARHRGWIEFGSSVLNRIAAFYSARSEAALAGEACALSEMFGKVEAELGEGPWFAGDEFSLVDATYGPIFRYFDVFERIDDFVSFNAFPKLSAWRSELARKPSVQKAVTPDYPERLLVFLKNRESALGTRVRATPVLSY
jgi:glutathione S-transferase